METPLGACMEWECVYGEYTRCVYGVGVRVWGAYCTDSTLALDLTDGDDRFVSPAAHHGYSAPLRPTSITHVHHLVDRIQRTRDDI
jgi:hypothetical protein